MRVLSSRVDCGDEKPRMNLRLEYDNIRWALPLTEAYVISVDGAKAVLLERPSGKKTTSQ